MQFAYYFDGSRMRHYLALYQSAKLVDQSFVSQGGMREDVQVTRHPLSGRQPDVSVQITPDQTLARDSLIAASQNLANRQRKETNERVTAALRTATGNELGSDPDPWWDWWSNYNEVYQPPYKLLSWAYQDLTPPPSTYRVVTANDPAQRLNGPRLHRQRFHTARIFLEDTLAFQPGPSSPPGAVRCPSNRSKSAIAS